MTRTVRTVIGKLRSFAAYEVGVRVRDVSDALKIRALRASVARGNGLHGDFDGLSVRTIYRHAERKYEPAGRLDAPILLIRAGRDGCEDPSDEPLLVRYRDPLFGWGRRAAGGPSAVTLVDVPGGHSGMLQEPHVSAVAAPIRAAIDCAVSLEAGS